LYTESQSALPLACLSRRFVGEGCLDGVFARLDDTDDGRDA